MLKVLGSNRTACESFGWPSDPSFENMFEIPDTWLKYDQGQWTLSRTLENFMNPFQVDICSQNTCKTLPGIFSNPLGPSFLSGNMHLRWWAQQSFGWGILVIQAATGRPFGNPWSHWANGTNGWLKLVKSSEVKRNTVVPIRQCDPCWI